MPKAGHNIKYDWQVLRRAGVELAGVAYDSMLASFVLDPGRRSHAIDTLALEHLGRGMQTYTDLTGKGRPQIPFAEVPVADAAAYCGADSATVLALHEIFAPAAQGDARCEPLLDDIEMPLVEVLVDMEWAGIADRPPRSSSGCRASWARDLARLEARDRRRRRARRSTSTRRSSSAQVLFEKHQLPVLKKTKTGPSTDADVLEQLAAMGHELPRLILEYRELQKLKIAPTSTRCPPAVNRAHRADPHQLQPDRRRHRAALARPTRTCRTSRSARRAARRSARGFVPRRGGSFLVARLLADRAAPDGAPLGRPGLHRRRSARAATSTARPRRSSSACRSPR